MNPVIEMNGVSKKFILPHSRENSLRGTFLNFGKSRRYERYAALRDITLRINRGQFVGIIGRNGAGKSLLLKLLAGIYPPSEGQILVEGNLLPFLELGFGANAELTGKENIFLYGAILGLGKKEIRMKYEDIINFSELGRFMDQKLKYYSSGMQLRLAFSVSIQVDASIFLIDEVLAIGDAAFQEKCETVFRNFRESGKTVLYVSHDLNSVEKWCEKTILLNEGSLVGFGDTREMIHEYLVSYAGKKN